jgi:hypothetical protein
MKSDLLGLTAFAGQRLRDRLQGLTDEEYFWEPVPDCWTVRPADGVWRADEAVFPPEPAPFTTIAWRLSHIIDLLSAERNATWIGVPPEPVPYDDAPGTADEARQRLEKAYELFRGYVEAVDEETLGDTMGPIAGPYADSSRESFILHELDELIHHGAEVGTVRDLFRATRPQDPFVAACLRNDVEGVEAQLTGDVRATHPAMVGQAAAAGAWDVVRFLAERGFDVNASPEIPAAHYAAGAGDLDLLRLLVDHGADLSARDPRFNHTPRGWAQYFGRIEVADYLRN